MSKRKFLSPAQKIAIVREHLIDGIPVSALVDKHKIHAVQPRDVRDVAAECRKRARIGVAVVGKVTDAAPITGWL